MYPLMTHRHRDAHHHLDKSSLTQDELIIEYIKQLKNFFMGFYKHERYKSKWFNETPKTITAIIQDSSYTQLTEDDLNNKTKWFNTRLNIHHPMHKQIQRHVQSIAGSIYFNQTGKTNTPNDVVVHAINRINSVIQMDDKPDGYQFAFVTITENKDNALYLVLTNLKHHPDTEHVDNLAIRICLLPVQNTSQ